MQAKTALLKPKLGFSPNNQIIKPAKVMPTHIPKIPLVPSVFITHKPRKKKVAIFPTNGLSFHEKIA